MPDISKHGCFNRVIKDSYRGRERIDKLGNIIFKDIKHIMSKECIYSKETFNDSKCSGCNNQYQKTNI